MIKAWLIKFLCRQIYKRLPADILDILKQMKVLSIRDVLENMAKKSETPIDNEVLKWEARFNIFITHGTALERLQELARMSKTEEDDKLIKAFFEGIE